jgi:creatinine amidohydrolase
VRFKNIITTSLFMIVILFVGFSFSQTKSKALVLQEMSWFDVKEYLKNSDMVIIPLGSTEQHGPHLPLGTDCYLATGMCKMISAETGIVVAPVVLSGYSVYHSGFPGTLSLKPETMEQVIFETAEMLMKYGFRRFLFFNGHGGNRIVEQKVMHRINHTTEAIAVSIGHGSTIQKEEEEEDFFDWHAGLSETSMMLYLKPELVKMERAEKPKIKFSKKVEKLISFSQDTPELAIIWNSMMGVPEETLKEGSSAELSSNGVWSLSDPKKATAEQGEKPTKKMVDSAVKFILAWNEAESSKTKLKK